VHEVVKAIEPIPYEQLYIEEFLGLSCDESAVDASCDVVCDASCDVVCDASFSHLKNIFIEETTPSGLIFMNYDNDDHGFNYYTNTSISYKFLDTVARKYMVENDCKSLNINLSLEFEKLAQKNKLLEENKQKKENIIDSSDEDCVYVKFKTYNLKSNKVTKHTIKEKLNNFKKVGNIYDYMHKHEKNENKEPLPEKKTLNYKNYKKNKEI
jgi:hypothetical protein